MGANSKRVSSACGLILNLKPLLRATINHCTPGGYCGYFPWPGQSSTAKLCSQLQQQRFLTLAALHAKQLEATHNNNNNNNNKNNNNINKTRNSSGPHRRAFAYVHVACGRCVAFCHLPHVCVCVCVWQLAACYALSTVTHVLLWSLTAASCPLLLTVGRWLSVVATSGSPGGNPQPTFQIEFRRFINLAISSCR